MNDSILVAKSGTTELFLLPALANRHGLISGATGTGKGKVRLVVQANDGPAREVVLTIAGQPFELRQDGR